MRLRKKGRYWVLDCEFEERDAPRSAGFVFHGLPCSKSGCLVCQDKLGKAWYTTRPELASKFQQYAPDKYTLELLSKEIQLVNTEIEKSRAKSATIDIPSPKGLNYRPFQKAGIEYMLQRKDTLLADAAGIGKTIQVVGYLNKGSNTENNVRKVLVICPATLRINWEKEIKKWLVNPLRIFVVEDELPDETAEFDILIVNYDKFSTKNRQAYINYILARDWDVLVCDEAHVLKSEKSLRTRSILGAGKTCKGGIVNKFKHRLFLTGTPILNCPIEIYPILRVIAPQEFGDWFQFARRYCDLKQTRFGMDVTGASNLKELQERLRATCMIRRLKSEVLPELPPKQRQIIPIPVAQFKKLIEQEDNLYQQIEKAAEPLKEILAKAKHTNNSATYDETVKKLRELYQVSIDQMSAVRKEVAIAKVPYVLEHVDNLLEQVNKIIIFAHHIDVIHALKEHYGAKAVCVYGDTKMKDRDAAVDKFQTQENIRVFIGGIKAAGVGITLTSASNIVFAELDWTPAIVDQCESRADRMGQLNSVLVQHIVFDGSLDARIAHKLVHKQEMTDKALDKGVTAIEGTSSLFDLLHTAEQIEIAETTVVIDKPKNIVPVTPQQTNNALTQVDKDTKKALIDLLEKASNTEMHLIRQLIKQDSPYTSFQIPIIQKLITKYGNLVASI